MSVPHYFIAIPLPAFLKDRYSCLQESLKDRYPYKQWTYKEDLHITLKFLGAVDEGRLFRLQKALVELETLHQFCAETGETGFFGSPKRPRVLWAGVKKTEALSKLQKKIESIAESCGFPPEKRVYKPHITLAKKWNGQPDENASEKIMQDALPKTDLLEIDEVVLYQINPQARPKYTPAAVYRLSGGGKNRPAD